MQSVKDTALSSVDKRREELVKFLRKVVPVPSATGQEGELQAYIADYLRDGIGLRVGVSEPSFDEQSKHPGAYAHPRRSSAELLVLLSAELNTCMVSFLDAGA
ncbi:MAG: hypothetical protein QXO30_04640 [Candidatus Caldarchaeum sp.]